MHMGEGVGDSVVRERENVGSSSSVEASSRRVHRNPSEERESGESGRCRRRNTLQLVSRRRTERRGTLVSTESGRHLSPVQPFGSYWAETV